MRRNWIALTIAPMLALTLTACNTAKNNPGDVKMTPSQTRSGIYGGTAGRAGYSAVPYDGHSATRRTAYDYLNDGRYAADGNGMVNGYWNSGARDLTQGARDLARGAGNAVGDVGAGIRSAADDVLNRR